MERFGEFFGHLVVGALMFIALLVFGGALSLLVHWVEPIFGDSLFLTVMQIVERVILIGDACFIVLWVFFSMIKAIKELSRE